VCALQNIEAMRLKVIGMVLEPEVKEVVAMTIAAIQKEKGCLRPFSPATPSPN
jgi:hypothetical protein